MINYFFTIGWEGNDMDGEQSFKRGSYEQMLEGITEYLDKYSDRNAFLVCCALEDKEATNLTNQAKKDLNLK